MSVSWRNFVAWTCALLVVLPLVRSAPIQAADPEYLVGLAKVDVTPAYPVRLSGFGFRRVESEGVTQPIWVKALAIKHAASPPAVLLTVDNLGIPASMVRRLDQSLHTALQLPLGRVTVTATHTHTAPMLSGVAPTLFGMPIPQEHQERIDRYTGELQEQLLTAARQALEQMQPGSLEFGIGQVGFARNRRTKGGPVDHDLPTLVVRNARQEIIGIYTNYACHCVTLSHNKIGGDWAGYAQSALEERFPGATALVAIGCGADANPDSGVVGDDTETAARQGNEIARGVVDVLARPCARVAGPISIQTKQLTLPFAPARTVKEWKERAERPDAIGYHAKVNLARLESNVPIPTTLDYPVQAWQFGKSMAWVFLPGEVVVDYALRLKRELDESKVWVTAYANDAPCYIPSERILREGGYEGEGAMVYYDRPGKFASGLETLIVAGVHSLLEDAFRPPPGTDGIAPKSPQESLQCFQTHDELQVELVAAEPLVIDPVAIDWDLDGNLWVAEMHDYPLGMNGRYEPGGRIKRLTDTNGDGQFDRATVFAEGLAFPTGVMATKHGILIGAAPDILLAQDTNQDGRADKLTKLFSGFADHNYQARVNSFQWGLDNWIHAANGLFGGEIQAGDRRDTVDTRGRDLRLRIPTQELQTVSGLSQQGRVRDDWGNWFGCQNGVLLQHYPLLQEYLDVVPSLPRPGAHSLQWSLADPGRLFPISKPLSRFNDVSHQGRVTSACGVGLYRDRHLGAEYYGNAFTCEPVHNLVRRTVLTPVAGTFSGTRAASEQQREFLSSTDHWFRPAQVRTGPDGGLWVVDMYRFLMEHPIWIRPERLAELDPRAGDDRGRIYRLVRKDGQHPRPALPAARGSDWIHWIQSSNGVKRDLAHQAIIEHQRTDLIPDLRVLAHTAEDPAVRVQVLSALTGLGAMDATLVRQGLLDSHQGVRRLAVRMLEGLEVDGEDWEPLLKRLAHDPHPAVRQQLGYSLARLRASNRAQLLAILLSQSRAVPYLGIGALASCQTELEDVVLASLERKAWQLSESQWEALLNIDASSGAMLRYLTDERCGLSDAARFRLVAKHWHASEAAFQLAAQARDLVRGETAHDALLEAAISLLGREPTLLDRDERLLVTTLDHPSPAIQRAVIQGLTRLGTASSLDAVLNVSGRLGPNSRSFATARIVEKTSWLHTVLKSDGAADFVRQLSPAQRDRLQRHPDPMVRMLAGEILQNTVPLALENRLTHYRAAGVLSGSPNRGQPFFAERCGSCHRLNGVGTAIGPDLRELTDRTFAAILQDIIHPNRTLLDQYVAYEIETGDDQVLSGLIVDETSTHVVLRTGNNESHRVSRSEITRLRSSGRSLMPEGLEADLSLQDMADLIVFVQDASDRTPPPRDPATIASFLMDPARAREERRGAVEIHYALAERLIPHLLAADEGLDTLYDVGYVAGRRNETRTLPPVIRILAAALAGRHSQRAVAGIAGVLDGLATHVSDPTGRLYSYLSEKQQQSLPSRLNDDSAATKYRKILNRYLPKSGTR